MTWWGFWPSPYGGLNVGDSRTSSERVVALIIAHRTPSPDFLLTSVEKSYRTEPPPKCSSTTRRRRRTPVAIEARLRTVNSHDDATISLFSMRVSGSTLCRLAPWYLSNLQHVPPISTSRFGPILRYGATPKSRPLAHMSAYEYL